MQICKPRQVRNRFYVPFAKNGRLQQLRVRRFVSGRLDCRGSAPKHLTPSFVKRYLKKALFESFYWHYSWMLAISDGMWTMYVSRAIQLMTTTTVAWVVLQATVNDITSLDDTHTNDMITQLYQDLLHVSTLLRGIQHAPAVASSVAGSDQRNQSRPMAAGSSGLGRHRRGLLLGRLDGGSSRDATCRHPQDLVLRRVQILDDTLTRVGAACGQAAESPEAAEKSAGWLQSGTCPVSDYMGALRCLRRRRTGNWPSSSDSHELSRGQTSTILKPKTNTRKGEGKERQKRQPSLMRRPSVQAVRHHSHLGHLGHR